MNGTPETVNFGASSTPFSIARGLAAAFRQQQSSPVSVSVSSGSQLTIGAKQGGDGSNYAYSVAVNYDSQDFASASFFASSDSGSLTGGVTGVALPIYEYNAAGGYDANGNVLGYTDSVMGAWGFSYDQLNRLTGATANPAVNGSSNFCWTYDAFGNRLQQSASNAAFSSSDGSCSTSGTLNQNTTASYNEQNQAIGYGYDGAGDVTADGANQYVYDAEGRLCAVQSMDPLTGTFDGNWTGYLYDAAGNRVAKGSLSSNVTASNACDITTNGFVQTAGYVVGPSGEQLTEVDASNNWKHTNVYAGGKQIGIYDGNVSAPTLHFYFDDPLGTRRAQTNSSGVLEATYQSLPFGDGLAQNPVTTTDDPTENHFTGKERDSETGEANGNDYFGARYYSSSMGRFLSPDPIFGEAARVHDPQQWNMYAYARNNPLAITDPTGMDENIHCGGDDSLSCHNGWDGLFQFDKNGILIFVKTDVDMNNPNDASAGYHDQWNNQYTGTFDQNNGVSFTNTATGETSTNSQFIDGSNPTQLIGAQTPGSAFAGMRATFFDACGSSSSCQGQFTLSGTQGQFQTMESTLHPQGGFKTFLDGFSGAHPFFTDQWKGGGPHNDYVHMISTPGYRMNGHFEGSTDPGIHAFSTIKDLVDGAAFGERRKLVPGNDY